MMRGMPGRRFLSFAGLLFVLLAAVPTPASAGADVFRARGLGASVDFYTPAECVDQLVWVGAGEGEYHMPPLPREPIMVAAVGIWKYDYCNGIPLMDAYSGDIILSPGDFRITRNLDSAALNFSAELYDWLNNETFTVNVELTFTGMGEAQRGNYISHFWAYGVKYQYRSKGVSRQAEVTGGVWRNETNLVADASDVYAYLSRDQVAEMLVWRR